jgi:hypothetical protein
MNIFPHTEHEISNLPVVIITVDSDSGPQTIKIYGATEVRGYVPGGDCAAPESPPSAHLRMADDWCVVTPRG